MSINTPTKQQRVERHLMRVRGAGKTARNLTGELFSFSICTKVQEDKVALPPAKKRKLQPKDATLRDAETVSLPQHMLKPTAELAEKPSERLTAKARARARAARLFDDSDSTASNPRSRKKMSQTVQPEAASSSNRPPHPPAPAEATPVAYPSPRNTVTIIADALDRSSRQQDATQDSSHRTDLTVSRAQSTAASAQSTSGLDRSSRTVLDSSRATRPRIPLSSMSPNREVRDQLTMRERAKSGSTTTRVPTKSSGNVAVSKTVASSPRKSRRVASAEAYKIMLKPMPTPKPRKRRLAPAENDVDVDYLITNISTLTR